MGAGGDFGEDPAILGVQVDLGGNHVRLDAVAASDDSGGGFIAGCFDGEDLGHAGAFLRICRWGNCSIKLGAGDV